MRKIVAVVAAAAVPLVSAGAIAQETSPVVLQGVQGAVYVVSDGRVSLARAGEGLAPGDRVLALSGGSARLGSADGCSRVLPSGATATVVSETGCAGRFQEANAGYIAADYTFQAPDAGGGAASAEIPTAGASSTSGTILGMSVTNAVIGGVTTAGIVAGAAVAFSGSADHGDTPASS